MYLRLTGVLVTLAAIAVTAGAQTFPRNASIRPSGDPGRGKCTIEVVVDGAVEVEVRGDSAILRNLYGQPPQWRRFECTGPLPRNPGDFRFAGVDGRGKQELVRDPRNGGVAIVRIEDKQGGSEGYTFDLFWSAGPEPRGDRDRERSRRTTTAQALQICQDAVRQRAAESLRARNIDFQKVTLDDNPGRNDWVVGTFGVRRDRFEMYRFSCSVDFDSGRVRSAKIEPMDDRR